ncbi:S1 RNA-binding domain-containing protein [Microgenomates group bacterium]|nr:S1 RNA-binding domain-containing protein [Microgenomates group bacterium]
MANAKTMADLLANNKFKIIAPKKDDVVEGVITVKNSKSLVIDVGAKTEGILVGREFDEAADYIEKLEVGQKVEAMVMSVDHNKGQILLSIKHAAAQEKWDFFIEAMEKAEVLEATGIETNKGGLIVVVNGVRGFVPSSQFGKKYLGNLQKLKGQVIKVKVIEVEKEKNRLIFSEKFVSEAKELAAREQALGAVKTGEVYEGVVSGVMPFGLFITAEVPTGEKGEVGLVEGLVHISEISWEKVTTVGAFYKLGDRVKVKVMGIDAETNKLNLSIKQLTPDPWSSAMDKYPVGSVVTGTVSRIEPYGVFVNVESGIDGLVHASKLENDMEKMQKGEKVSVNVENIDLENKRMSLSLISNELPVDYK